MQITIMGCLGFTNLKRTIKKAAALPSTYQPIKHTTLSVKAPYKVIHVSFSQWMNECGFPVTTQLQCQIESTGLTINTEHFLNNVCNCISEPRVFIFFGLYSSHQPSLTRRQTGYKKQESDLREKQWNRYLLVAQPPCHPQWHQADPLYVFPTPTKKLPNTEFNSIVPYQHHIQVSLNWPYLYLRKRCSSIIR